MGYDGCVCWAANVAMIWLWRYYSTVHENTVMQWYIVCGITCSGIRRSKVLSGWGCECDDGDGCVCGAANVAMILLWYIVSVLVA